MVHGEKAGDLIRLQKREIVIGRGAQADIRLQDDGVSRIHAKIVLHPTGAVEIIDLDSTNGTYVDGESVRSSFLTEGVSIGVGPFEFFRFGHYADSEADLQHQLYTTATRDGLTGALNRRHLMVRLRQEFGLALRSDVPLCAVLLDVDHFKQVNDTYGHAAGDEVLRGLVERVRPSLRTYDLFGRYGGEEFALILRQTDVENALVIAERTRRLVCEGPFDMPEGVTPSTLSVSVSLGLAMLDSEAMSTPESLLHAADQALYRAKAGGRNCVRAHAHEP